MFIFFRKSHLRNKERQSSNSHGYRNLGVPAKYPGSISQNKGHSREFSHGARGHLLYEGCRSRARHEHLDRQAPRQQSRNEAQSPVQNPPLSRRQLCWDLSSHSSQERRSNTSIDEVPDVDKYDFFTCEKQPFSKWQRATLLVSCSVVR